MAKLSSKSEDPIVTALPLAEAKASQPVRRGSDSLQGFEKSDLVKRRIIHPGMKDIDVLNSFRELRTSILPKLDRFNSVLQVSAIHSAGGASFSALNLAVSCTFDLHRNAVLVDCNFEKPTLHKTLEVDANVGLYDFLTDQVANLSDIFYPTRIPRLSLVPSGNIDDKEHIEFFTGNNMRRFLEDIRNRYEDRIIIVDTPPLLESADAKILAEVVDNILIVLPYKKVTSRSVNKMIKAVGKDKIVGMVINN